MTFILEDDDDYEIYFAHQCDNRNFNRGGTKNIGFLALKEKLCLWLARKGMRILYILKEL